MQLFVSIVYPSSSPITFFILLWRYQTAGSSVNTFPWIFWIFR